MKNINFPEKIFLQSGILDENEIDFNSLDFKVVSWAADKIFFSDVEYINIEKYNQLLKTFQEVLNHHILIPELKDFYMKRAKIIK